MVTKHRSGRACADKGNPVVAGKETLRIYAGWKHREKHSQKMAKQVLLSQGGGCQHVDIARGASLNEVLQKIQDTFFPDGENKARQLLLKELKCKLTKFSGNEVRETLQQ